MNLSRVTLATASSVLLLATLAACGSDSDSGGAAAPEGGDRAAFGGQGGVRPGASGEVAAVSGRTAQVQSQASGQVAVSWTGDTTFTAQVDAGLADVTVGSCVVVTTADGADAGATEVTEVTASTVRITPASDDGGCGFGTVGEVTAVSGTGFTVSATQPGADTDADATDVTVTVDPDTTYTTNAKANASAVEVGVCVNAQGEPDDTGAVSATSISVSQPVDGECAGGFGMGGPGGAS